MNRRQSRLLVAIIIILLLLLLGYCVLQPRGDDPDTAQGGSATPEPSVEASATETATPDASTPQAATEEPTASPSPTPTAEGTPPPLVAQDRFDDRAGAQTSQVSQAGEFGPTVTADDFSIADGGSVGGLSWAGIYCRQEDAASEPDPTASSFVVSFFPDAGGEPDLDSPISSQTLDIDEVAETRDSALALMCGTANSTWAFYTYEARLPDAFDADAGVTYWVSIQAVTPDYGTYWGWLASGDGNDLSVQVYDGELTEFAADRTFTLVVAAE